MQSFAILATSIFAVLAAAAPSRSAERQFKATVIFEGAAGASFELSVPTDGSLFYIYNTLSISHIESYGGASCSFSGVDGSVTTIVGQSGADVGLPQTQVSGSCLAL